uniref:Putative trypsin-like serine protease n=1 Tax=Corethrella appendiculata TaxID=1370023 RepID=U5EYM3_9DIPT
MQKYAFLVIFICFNLILYVNSFECGKRKTKISGLIKSGYQALEGTWPWHVAIYRLKIEKFNSKWEYSCGGTLLSDKIVLTAAHCLYDGNNILSESSVQVKLGKYRLRVNDAYEITRGVSKLFIHEEYNVSTYRHDIALLQLNESSVFNDYIQPACLWDVDPQTSNSVIGTDGFVNGWGYIENNTLSDTLNQATIPMIDYLTCIESNPYGYPTMLNRFNYCAGYRNGTSVCNGDSGGGMFYKIGNEWQIRGIVSFSELRDDYSFICDAKQYAVFTDVAAHIDWIKSKDEINPRPSRPKDEILDHPNYHLINSHDCGVNSFPPTVPEYLKPIFLNFPWMVAIKYDIGINPIKCFGTLINKFYVLTAEHCTNSRNNKIKSVILGDFDLDTDPDCYRTSQYDELKCTQSIQEVNVKSIIRRNQTQPRLNDIALIRLETAADITKENVKTICLPATESLRTTEMDEYIVTGWPLSLEGSKDLEGPLFRYNVKTLNHETCDVQKFNIIWDFNENICTKTVTSKSNICKPILSGSPLQSIQLIDNQYKYTQFGILAFGTHRQIDRRCIEESITGSTRITKHLKWILDNISGDNLFFDRLNSGNVEENIRNNQQNVQPPNNKFDLHEKLIFL